MNDEQLDRLVRDLPRGTDVPPEVEDALWAEVEPRIEPRRRAMSWGMGLAAAMLLISASVWALAPRASTARPGMAALPQTQPVLDERDGLLPAEDDLQAAVVDLQRAYQQRRGGLDPAVLAIYDENLELVGDAVARSRDALAQNPGDRHLQRMLRRAYDQHLSLLARATRPGGGS